MCNWASVVLNRNRCLLLAQWIQCHVLAIVTHEIINPSPPSVAYMRQWIGSALVQIMACRLFRRQDTIWNNAGLLSSGLFTNKRQWNFSQNRKLFVHENASENIVGEMHPFCSGEDELNAGHFNLISCTTPFVTVMYGSIDPEIMCLKKCSICTSLGGLNSTINSQRETVYFTRLSLHLRLASVPKQAFTFKVGPLYSNTGLLMYFYLYLYVHVLCIDAFMFIWWCQYEGALPDMQTNKSQI